MEYLSGRIAAQKFPAAPVLSRSPINDESSSRLQFPGSQANPRWLRIGRGFPCHYFTLLLPSGRKAGHALAAVPLRGEFISSRTWASLRCLFRLVPREKIQSHEGVILNEGVYFSRSRIIIRG